MPRIRFSRRLVAIVVVAILATGIVVIWDTLSAVNRAEYGLHAAHRVTLLICEYVRRHDKWPASWKEIEAVYLPDDTSFKWDLHPQELRKYVRVDFSAKCESLSLQSAETFQAIEPIGPYYDGYRLYFPALIETLREHCGGRESGTRERSK